MARKAKINRKTKETNIAVEANLDGKGSYKINTRIGFLNHMLEQLSKHSLIDLKIFLHLILSLCLLHIQKNIFVDQQILLMLFLC